MPITNFEQIKRFTEHVRRDDPGRARARSSSGRADDPEAVAELGVAYATLQCADLLARGAPGIHFYTLNRSPATRAILAALRAAHPWTRAPPPSSVAGCQRSGSSPSSRSTSPRRSRWPR